MTVFLLAALVIAPAAAGDVMEKVETGEIIVIPSVDKYNPDLSGSRVLNQITIGRDDRPFEICMALYIKD